MTLKIRKSKRSVLVALGFAFFTLLWGQGPQILLSGAGNKYVPEVWQKHVIYGALTLYGRRAIPAILKTISTNPPASINRTSRARHLAEVLKAIGPPAHEALAKEMARQQKHGGWFAVLELGYVATLAFDDFSWLPFEVDCATWPCIGYEEIVNSEVGYETHFTSIHTVLVLLFGQIEPGQPVPEVGFGRSLYPDFVRWYRTRADAGKFPPITFTHKEDGGYDLEYPH